MPCKTVPSPKLLPNHEALAKKVSVAAKLGTSDINGISFDSIYRMLVYLVVTFLVQI